MFWFTTQFFLNFSQVCYQDLMVSRSFSDLSSRFPSLSLFFPKFSLNFSLVSQRCVCCPLFSLSFLQGFQWLVQGYPYMVDGLKDKEILQKFTKFNENVKTSVNVITAVDNTMCFLLYLTDSVLSLKCKFIVATRLNQ